MAKLGASEHMVTRGFYRLRQRQKGRENYGGKGRENYGGRHISSGQKSNNLKFDKFYRKSHQQLQ